MNAAPEFCEDGLHGAHHRPEVGVLRRSAILFALQLILGASSGAASSEPTESAPRAETDSVEVVRGGQEYALEQSERRFLPFAGKYIGRIRVRNLDVFGTSIADTTRSAKSRLLRILNNLNFRTRKPTIVRNLLFREGDSLEPFRVADSERILRNLAFIRDARISVSQNPSSDDSVNVLVIVMESWTLMLSGSPKEGNGLKASLTEQNLLGLGHEVSGALTIVPNISPRFDAKYFAQNIRASFINGHIEYVKMPAEKTIAFGFSRDLVSSVLGYAGGLDLKRTSITATDTLTSPADNTSDLVDLWAGRALHLGHRQQGIDRRRVFFVSGRIRRLKFNERPSVTSSTFHQYHNIAYFLGSIALIQSRYYRTNLLYNYGRIEDIPYGFLARVTYGLADEEFTRKVYASTTLSAGQKINRLGYGVGQIQIGGFPKGDQLDNGVLRLRTLYFSNLLHAGGYRFRQFISAEYTRSVHRRADDTIDFRGDEGIRGVAYDSGVIGSKRLLLGLETVAFTPWRVGGVTFACFTFADLDIIGSGHENLLAQNYYSGLGFGLRLHKEAFGIGSVQLRFAWYPRLPVDHSTYSYTAFGEKRFRSIEFLGGGPEIIEY
jgi:hypothetical protein